MEIILALFVPAVSDSLRLHFWRITFYLISSIFLVSIILLDTILIKYNPEEYDDASQEIE